MRVFKPNSLYRNKHQKDVDMWVANILSADQRKEAKLTVFWVTRFGQKILSVDEVIVKADQYKDWKETNK